MAYDVIVVGGGPAGSASAALFATQGRSVVLLEAARFPRRKACAEYISPGGVSILERLGALERLTALGAGRRLRGMEIHSPGGGSHLVEYRDRRERQQLGLSVPRLVLDQILVDIARIRGAEVREGWRVRALWRDRGRVRGVTGPAGEQLQADLVVGADGANSVVAQAAGVRRRVAWPRRLGLVAHVAGVAWPEDYGRMLVGRRGYLGVAPLDDLGLLSIGLVRSMPEHRLGAAAAALEAGLADFPEIAARLHRGHLIGPIGGVGPLARRVRACAGEGWALVGDAAGFFDPFTGEGIYRALRSAELLTSNPETYVRDRRRTFAAKERLVALVQVLVQTPRLLDFALERLRRRPGVARELGAVLGDVQPARLDLAWRLLGP